MELSHRGGIEFQTFFGNNIFFFQTVYPAADFRQLAEFDFSAAPHDVSVNLDTAQVHVFHGNNYNILFDDDFIFFLMKVTAGVVLQKLENIFRSRQVAADTVCRNRELVVGENQRCGGRIIKEAELSGQNPAPVQTGNNVFAVSRYPAVDKFRMTFFVINFWPSKSCPLAVK